MGKGHEFVPTNLVGQSIPRLDAYEKVTGRARFTRDQTEPGMLYTKVLRSPHAHAWIRSIDTSEALQMYGVMEIIHCFNTTDKKFNWTNEPVQSPPYFQIVKDQCFFNREVRYVGDEVCAVAAISEEIAAEACKAIRVEYEVLPAVLTAEEAAAEDAPILHPDVNPKTNLAFKSENRTGDAEAAFAGCAAVVEGTYKMGVQKQMQLETQNALAWLAGDGRLTVWSPTQSPALVQRLVSWICEIPMSKVRVVNPGYVGGAFGVRIGLSSKAEIYAVELAKRTNCPVKFVYDRHEDMIASETRHGGQIHIRLGCDAGGCLQALEGRALMEGGAYALSSASLCGAVASRMQTVYHIPKVHRSLSSLWRTASTGWQTPSGWIRWSFARKTSCSPVIPGWCPMSSVPPECWNAWTKGPERSDGPTERVFERAGSAEATAWPAEITSAAAIPSRSNTPISLSV